jgi:hypothetical protein
MTFNELETTGVNPVAVNVSVYVPAVSTDRFVNVATPLTTATVVVPPNVAPPGVVREAVTEPVSVVKTLPVALSR